MAMPEPETPRAIGIVGWFSIIVAVLFTLAGATLLWTTRQAETGVPGFAARAALSLVVGLAMLGAGIQFLRLREAGRRVLVGVYWFGIGCVIVFTVWDIASGAPVIAAGRRSIYILAVSLLAMFAAVQLVVIGLILSALRSPEVRRAMRG